MEGKDRLLIGGVLFGAMAGLLMLSRPSLNELKRKCAKTEQLYQIQAGEASAETNKMEPRWSLQGKCVIVTGGTLGIGKAIVEECSKLGAVVLTCGRKPENMTECFKEWHANGLRNIHGCIADMSTSEGRAQLLASVEKTFPNKTVDVLVNNVGTNIRKLPLEYTEEEYQLIMQTNLHSAFHLTKEIYPYLRKKSTNDPNGTSSVINIGSVAGTILLFLVDLVLLTYFVFSLIFLGICFTQGGCNTAIRSGIVYAMTKAAMAQMTFNLACEWAKEAIRVNTIAPWYIDTPLTQPVLTNPELLAVILKRTPMGRTGRPEEVSGLAAFLAMDHSAYITGQIIGVDGGFLRNGFF
jgi:Tropinone reductase 1